MNFTTNLTSPFMNERTFDESHTMKFGLSITTLRPVQYSQVAHCLPLRLILLFAPIIAHPLFII